ncbi:MAG: HAD-IA family hydrolase [Gammaproteobacteria bacterium]|nr:HAD-IA family hydrolase [Gammaproteobacteria bacterium]
MKLKSEAFSSWMSSIKVIGFDLDDTLWNNSDVIIKAIDAQYQYFMDHQLNSSRQELEAAYVSISQKLISAQPKRYQDVTQLRNETLKQLCVHFGLDLKHAMGAFSAFYKQRQKVKLYDEVIPLLEKLSQKYTLMVISNGNSNLEDIGIADFFNVHLQAGRDGEAKPSGDMLLKALSFYDLKPHEYLYVGDNFHTDGQAVINAGVKGLVIPSNPAEHHEQTFNTDNIKVLDNLLSFLKLVG